MKIDAEMQAVIDAQKPRLTAEEEAVRSLGEQIGYGRLMQATETVWRRVNESRGMVGAEYTTGPCAASTVPCLHMKKNAEKAHPDWFVGGHCEWCCGAGCVTKRVAKAMTESKGP